MRLARNGRHNASFYDSARDESASRSQITDIPFSELFVYLRTTLGIGGNEGGIF